MAVQDITSQKLNFKISVQNSNKSNQIKKLINQKINKSKYIPTNGLTKYNHKEENYHNNQHTGLAAAASLPLASSRAATYRLYSHAVSYPTTPTNQARALPLLLICIAFSLFVSPILNMQSLLLERSTGRLRPRDFAVTVTESLYSTLRPVNPNIFPENCHHSAAVNSLAVETLDYRYMLSGCADSSIKLWDLHGDREAGDESDDVVVPVEDTKTPQILGNRNSDTHGRRLRPLVSIPRRSAHEYGVSVVKWWPRDTGMFLSASFDHTVKVWDTNAVDIVHTFDLASRVYAIDVSAHQSNAFSSQALIAVASDQPAIRLLDLRSASSAHTLSGHRGKTLTVCWHPQNAALLASGGHDGEAKIWDIRMSRSCVARLDVTKTNIRSASLDALNLGSSSVKAHSGPVNALVWDELGHVLYTAGNDDKIRVWDMSASHAPPLNRLVNFGPLTRNKYLQTLPLVLSPKNETEVQHLFFASDNGDVLVFRAVDGKLVSRLQRSGSKSSARTASIAYAGPYSATYFCGTMDGEIVAWRGQRQTQGYSYVGDVGHLGAEASLAHGSMGSLQNDHSDAAKRELFDDPYFKHNLG
ncbi:hypothetical protein JCM33374_g6031 [Metschnikowia sp. JCM 33374]|nr:hypothetical protein JCM33374_g6031 [Metschnikowia sp. JCM 33374]